VRRGEKGRRTAPPIAKGVRIALPFVRALPARVSVMEK